MMNNRDFNINDNNHDYRFGRNRAALVPSEPNQTENVTSTESSSPIEQGEMTTDDLLT